MKVLDLFSGYTIREDGEVRNRHGRKIAQQISNMGYLRVELWKDGKGKKYSVHRLVAMAFIPNPKDLPQVNHLDGNKANNHYSNLEWATQSENQKHAYSNGLQTGFKKSTPLSESHKKALCGSRWKKEVHVYSLDGCIFTNLYDAADHFKVSRQTILNRCKSGKYPKWKKEVHHA